MLSEEEFKQVREQLFKQIESFPEEQKEAARQQIEAMNSEQLEEFLIKNNLIKQDSCIFCSIANGETLSYKIAENNNSIAVLDINPLSEGQVLIIPKMHKTIEDTPDTFNLAQGVSKLLKEKLNADDVKIESTSVQGHGLINVVPIYKDKKLERKKAEDKELYNLQQKLIQKPEKEEPREIKEVRTQDLPEAPKRRP